MDLDLLDCFGRKKNSVLKPKKYGKCRKVYVYDSSFQIIFEGIRGRSYRGDIAIDDVSVAGGQCGAPGKGFTRKISVRNFTC